MIYVVRGQKVMLDSDHANLYEVETNQLNRQVRRNILRFPEDFMFQLSSEELREIKKIKNTIDKYGGQRKNPYVFTENGVAMLSSVLNWAELYWERKTMSSFEGHKQIFNQFSGAKFEFYSRKQVEDWLLKLVSL